MDPERSCCVELWLNKDGGAVVCKLKINKLYFRNVRTLSTDPQAVVDLDGIPS